MAVAREEAAAGRRISEDLEWGIVDGEQSILVAGFGWGRYLGKSWDSWSGGARSVVLDHPEGRASSNLKRRVVRIMEDASIRKVMHNGRSDVDISRDLLGAKLGVDLRGYDFDTYLGAYLKDSWRPAFGLEAMVNEFLPEFGDFKDSVADWDGNFAEAPLENPEGLKKHQEQLIAAGITNSYVYISPGTSHEWQTWRRSLYVFAPLLFR